ncbi:hypothetical protein [Porphyromonas uenonis]|uniref:hypothetical protein n=1 Tax=Porphyromonas uenonis TaxID=281920 RepID=UPI000A3F5947|nr:hypothetical protein [Porphyromonas uenonis]
MTTDTVTFDTTDAFPLNTPVRPYISLHVSSFDNGRTIVRPYISLHVSSFDNGRCNL